ncbi:hypothetical protein pb186bvf_007315 [Paramecium bursaria]
MEEQYEKKCKEYEQLEQDYKALQEEDQILINAQEQRINDLEKQLALSQNKSIQLQEQLQKLKKELNQDIKALEKQLSQKEQLIDQLTQKNQSMSRKIVELEIDSDHQLKKNREIESQNRDLEVKLDFVLEQNALVQTELETYKNDAQEQIERLKQEIKDQQDELFATRKHRIASQSSINEYARLFQQPTADNVRANAAGFNKSLTLISALIKDLDDKMLQILIMNKYISNLKKLNTIGVFRKDKSDLSEILKMVKILGDPHKKLQFIHIAGTNGKGSVTVKMQKLLQQHGKIGCYTSPHLFCFRERIKIDDEMIPEEYVADNIEYLFKLVDQHKFHLSFFDIITCLALKYYEESKVDYVSWETGLGGRLDSTNIVDPMLSIITSIGYDHQQILGSSLNQIAYEKAGIIKQGKPSLIGINAQPYDVFINEAKLKKSPLTIIIENQIFFQELNNQIVERASNILYKTYGLSFNSLKQAQHTSPMCRMEKVPQDQILQLTSKKIKIILDVGHNVSAIEQVVLYFQKEQPPIVIYGTSSQKDSEASLKVLKDNSKAIFLVQANHFRAKKIQNLENLGEIIQEGNIYSTIMHVIKQAKDGDSILIIGSFYIMREARESLMYYGLERFHRTQFLN